MRRDARRSFRITTPEHQQRGVLVLGRKRFPVLMLNASADGFAFLSPQPISATQGAVARLQADDAWYEVAIIRADQTDEGLLIGVERLADLGDLASRPWNAARESGGQSGASKTIALSAIVLCTALSAYLIAGTSSWLPVAVSDEVGIAEVAAPPVQFVAHEPAIRRHSPVGEQLRAVAAVDMERREAAAISARQRTLLSDQTAAELHLTTAQRRELQRLLGPRPDASSDEAPWEAARQIEARILQVLTPKQVAQWRTGGVSE